jgi:hypothetical protein
MKSLWKGGFLKTADLHDADRRRMEKEMAELLVKIDKEIDQKKEELQVRLIPCYG